LGDIKRVFVLGPSHYAYVSGCALSVFDSVSTPFGVLESDVGVTQELGSSGIFDYVSEEEDVQEHSLEMQYPFLKYVLREDIPIVPLLVGEYTKGHVHMLSKYVNESLFVVSSDFCHWGRRFGYTYMLHEEKTIHEMISELDHEGISFITSGDVDGFKGYLGQTRNTICGRNPITFVMELLSVTGRELHYTQSSKVRDKQDSSVSYAAIALF
jgi:AmmeMemoRadiSam system protein B